MQNDLEVEVPLSEDHSKFKQFYTKEDCINELKDVAEAEPERVITRNYFRNASDISESTWTRYFGTFHEFKRAAISFHHAMHKD